MIMTHAMVDISCNHHTYTHVRVISLRSHNYTHLTQIIPTKTPNNWYRLMNGAMKGAKHALRATAAHPFSEESTPNLPVWDTKTLAPMRADTDPNSKALFRGHPGNRSPIYRRSHVEIPHTPCMTAMTLYLGTSDMICYLRTKGM